VLVAQTTGGPFAVGTTDNLATWAEAVTNAITAVREATRRAPDVLYLDVAVGSHLVGLISTVSPANTGSFCGLRLVVSDGPPAGTAIVGVSERLLVAETEGAPLQLQVAEPALGGLEVGLIGSFAVALIDGDGFGVYALPRSHTHARACMRDIRNTSRGGELRAVRGEPAQRPTLPHRDRDRERGVLSSPLAAGRGCRAEVVRNCAVPKKGRRPRAFDQTASISSSGLCAVPSLVSRNRR
jgi:hypothetical protein